MGNQPESPAHPGNRADQWLYACAAVFMLFSGIVYQMDSKNAGMAVRRSVVGKNGALHSAPLAVTQLDVGELLLLKTVLQRRVERAARILGVVHGRFNHDRELVRVLAIERLEHAVEKAWQLADGDRTRNLDCSSVRFGRARIRRGQDEIASHVFGDLERKFHRTIARLGQAVDHALVFGCLDQGRPDRGLIYLPPMQRFDHANEKPGFDGLAALAVLLENALDFGRRDGHGPIKQLAVDLFAHDEPPQALQVDVVGASPLWCAGHAKPISAQLNP